MAERNRLFARHPKTTFIAAHFAYHANDLARLGRLLDEHPNVVTETGAILAELGRQPRAARAFFIKYQDRILFGKDCVRRPTSIPYFWRTFETADEYFDYYRDYHAFWKLYGLDLPDVVLQKLYYGNALRLVPGLRAATSRPWAGPRPHGAETLDGALARHRRRRIHRIASGRRPCSIAARRCASPTTSARASRRNLAVLDGRAECSIGDLADVAFAARGGRRHGLVLHQAAIPSVPRSVADPLTSNRANVDATLAVLVAARDAGVRRLVYAASSSAYGDTPELPKREDMPPNPLSPYALQKLVGEQYLQLFTRLYGLDTVSIRYFNVFGPRQDPSSPYSGVIALFVTRAAGGPAADSSPATASRPATSPTSTTSSMAC